MYEQSRYVKGYVPWICVITCIYLVFELSFNASLLDTVGSFRASGKEIEHIEQWGRILSGVALTILVWGVFIMPRRISVTLRVIAMAISAYVCIDMAYVLEEKLVNHFVNISSAQQKKESLAINMIVDNISRDHINLNHMPLNQELRDTPSGKQMMAILPFYILSVKSVDDKISTGLKNSVYNHLVDGGMSSSVMYNKVYIPYVNKEHGAYKNYVSIVNDSYAHPSHASRNNGKLVEIFGSVPEQDYRDFRSFFSNDGIQSNLRKALHISNGAEIRPDYSYTSFKSSVWDSSIRKQTDKIYADTFNHSVSEFEIGGDQYNRGSDSMRSLVAIPIALFFSTLGALLHIFKSANYITMWTMPQIRFRRTIIISTIIIPVIIIAISTNTITSMPLYTYMKNCISTYYSHGYIIGDSITWLIKAQSWFYPINDFIRHHVLLDFNFH